MDRVIRFDKGLDRRKFLAGSGMACGAGISGMSIPVYPAHSQVGSTGIDTHCHVFNASDLPVKGFIQRVVFEDYEDAAVPEAVEIPSPFAGLLATLISFLKLGVISAEKENEMLIGGNEAIVGQFDPYSPSVQQELEAVLEQVLSPAESGAGGLAPEEILEFQRLLDTETAIGPQQGAPEGPLARRAARLLTGRGIVGRHLRWAAWLRSPRMKISEEINRLYGGSSRIGMFTPALIDYTNWLEEEPRSSIGSQITVMESVQRTAIGKRGFLLHSLAPYDPWRQIADVDAGAPVTALDRVKEAVEQRGFLGVKLYPPMGFLPYDNASQQLTYPVRAQQVTNFAEKLDQALDALYSWAAANGVTILSHAANSNGAGEGFSARANPSGWRPVLERHPQLRLCLAHFGGFTEDNWEESSASLMTDFPYVFVDLSYLSSSLATNQITIHNAVMKMRDFLARHDGVINRLVFGSDWIMLGREADHERYFEAVRQFGNEAGISRIQWNAIKSANTVRMLGLSGGQARARLEDWYNRSGLDASLLGRFD